MESATLLEQLVELAGAAGLEVRRISGQAGGEGEPSATSGICVVRGALWIVLSAADSPEERIAVLSEALQTHAGEFLETHYLPPAVRSRLGA